MDVLVTLAAREGAVVSRRALIESVWAEVAVGEEVLTRAISILRRALGDDARRPRVIETVFKRGYRLMTPVTPVRPSASDDGDVPIAEPEAAPALDPGLEPEPAVQPGPAALPRPWHRVALVASVVALVSIAGLLLAARRGADGASTGGAAEPVVLPTFGPEALLPLTTLPGHEFGARFAPDGESFAFVWEGMDGGDNYDIYVQRIGEVEPLRLTTSPAAERSPAWLPDGDRLVYVRTGPDGGIFLRPLIGGAERRIVDARFADIGGTTVSPDGRFVAFGARERDDLPYKLLRVDLDDLGLETLLEPSAGVERDFSPTWSPDGESIAFGRALGSMGDEDLWLLPLVGGPGGVADRPRRLSFDREYISGATWMPDGASLVYSSRRSGFSQLWQLFLDGGSRALSTSLTRLMVPSISRDGRHLGVTRKIVEHNIWFAESPTETPRRLVASTRLDLSPTFAPDGRTLAFISHRSGNPELWISRRDGSNLQRLTDFGGLQVQHPRWSPDGSRLVVETREAEGNRLVLVAANGSGASPLSELEGARLGSWSPDGRSILHAAERDGVWQVRRYELETRIREALTVEGGYAAQETEDGLFFTRRDRDGLWRQDTNGTRLVLEGFARHRYGQWQVVGSGLFYLDGGRHARLFRLDLDTGVSTELGPIGPLCWDDQPLSIDPLGDGFAFGRCDRIESDIWRVALGS